eukprot:1405589-Amphidinium_carterae.1
MEVSALASLMSHECSILGLSWVKVERPIKGKLGSRVKLGQGCNMVRNCVGSRVQLGRGLTWVKG